jgi:hypothetical protein
MINKIVMSLFALSVLCFSQENKKQTSGVELPDFVITGNEKVSVENAKKPEPDFVSTLSEEFLKPVFSSEQLEIKEFVNPIKENISLKDSVHFVKGRFNAGIGLYNLPTVGFLYTNPFSGGIFEGYASALNRRAFVSNSDRNKLNGGVNLSLFSSNDASFLPGTELKLHGNIDLNSYKFYAAPDPTTRRSFTQVDVSVKADNFLNDYFVFAAQASNEYSGLKNENYRENLFSFQGYAKLRLENIYVSSDVLIKKQFLNNDSLSGLSYGFFGITPKIGLLISDAVKFEFGINYANSLSQSYFTPYVSIALKLDNSLSLFGEYSPHSELITSSWFLKKNPWFNTGSFVNALVNYDGSFKFAIKYEYEKYYQINAGVKITSSSALPYFTDSSVPGRFDVAFQDASIFNGFADILFYTGPNGYLYGSADLTVSSDTLKLRIPYIPWSCASLAYGYRFTKLKLDTEVKMNYTSNVFTDLMNLSKLNSNIDLGLKFSYQYRPKFFITLELSNLLFHQNYTWRGYKEIPFNITAGLNIIL